MSQSESLVGFQFAVNFQIRKMATREQFTLSLNAFKTESQSLRDVAACAVSHSTFYLNSIDSQFMKGILAKLVD